MAYAFSGAGSPPRSVATTQDSLNIYNNALKVYNYYKGRKYKRNMDDTIREDPFYRLDTINEERNRRIKLDPNNETTTPFGIKLTKDVPYRKDFDANRFMQREMSNLILDTRAPVPLYDRRITPTINAHFSNTDPNDPIHEDMVNVFLYDPLQVKPVKYLTAKERIARGIGVPPVQPSSSPMLQIKKFVDIAKRRKQYPEMEQLTPKQAAFESNIQLDDNAQVKPLPIDLQQSPTRQMGSVLRYPAMQSGIDKLLMRLKGEPMKPYWVDEKDIKRYPAYGENNPEEVRMNRLLRGNLNPRDPEDAIELKRIDDLLRNKIELPR